MYYPKLTFASSIIEGIFLFGILCLSKKRSMDSNHIGNFQIIWKKQMKATSVNYVQKSKVILTPKVKTQ